jgi:hypothetical protein
LKSRYDIDLEDVGDEWEILYWSIGTPSLEDYRGNILVIAIHAAGWSGLAATQLASALWNPFFLNLSFFMIAFGVFHDFIVARTRSHPLSDALVRIRALLREYRDDFERHSQKAKANDEKAAGDN